MTNDEKQKAIRKGKRWLVRMGRLGYGVKGIVYIVMGVLAVIASKGYRKNPSDTQGALVTIGEAPFGRLALVIVVAGLFGYAAWRLISAATDAERRGDSPTGASLRIGAAFRGIAYGSLGVWTLRYLTFESAGPDNKPRSVTSRVLEWPLGRWLVIAFGLSLLGYAAYQIYRALSNKFLNRLALNEAGKKTQESIRIVGKFGIVARALVFGMIGLLFVNSGWTYDPSKAGGISKSLAEIAQQPWGGVLYQAVAFGLIGFGLFQIATARFRVMRAA